MAGIIARVAPLLVAFGVTLGCSSSERTAFGPGGNTTTPDGTTPDGELPQPDAARLGCAQDAYTETVPTTASLGGLTFSSSDAEGYILDALELRYPVGKYLTEGGLASPLAASQGNCITRFLRDTSSAEAVLRQASTVVHECGHFYDIGEASSDPRAAAYVITEETRFTCSSGDTTSRNGRTFARSLLKTDASYADRQACGGRSAQGCDMYADIYLDGDPTDSSFESGDQGYSFLLEEATQYVNSLATALAFEEAYAGRKVTERDGILTFLWYIGRYLRMARTDYPDAYELLSTDACWRQATLTVWDRGRFYLAQTKGKSSLGIDDEALEALAFEASLTAEIDALRKLECQ